LSLETPGFTYHKWGAQQTCKRGDWLVNNDGDIYTVDHAVFERTYQPVSTGLYRKVTPVWAEPATEAGSVITIEGESHYQAGDYLVYNNEDGTDAYCVARDAFEAMYEVDDAG